MADISTHLSRIKSAVYGEEVRGSIHDAIKAMNQENMSNQGACNEAKMAAEEARKKAQSAMENAAACQSEAQKASNAATIAKNEAERSASEAKETKKAIDGKLEFVEDLRTDLVTNSGVREPLLDSSGNVIFDSAGRNVHGRIVFTDNTDTMKLSKEVDALEYEVGELEAVKKELLRDVSNLLEMKEDLLEGNNVREPLLDSSGNVIFDSAGRNVHGRIVFTDNTDTIRLSKKVDALEYEVGELEAVKKELLRDVSNLLEMKEDLLEGNNVREPLLDSSGNVIFDSAGRNVHGRIVFTDNTDTIRLSKKVDALEHMLDKLMRNIFDLNSHALLDNTFNIL